MPDPSKPLKNQKRELFCSFVSSGHSYREAIILAGYSEKAARTTYSRFLKNVTIAARIEYLRTIMTQRVIEKTAIDAEKVLDWLVEIRTAAMAEGQYNAANKSTELIGKAVNPGMFSEKIDLGGSVNVRFNIKTGRK